MRCLAYATDGKRRDIDQRSFRRGLCGVERLTAARLDGVGAGVLVGIRIRVFLNINQLLADLRSLRGHVLFGTLADGETESFLHTLHDEVTRHTRDFYVERLAVLSRFLRDQFFILVAKHQLEG